MKKVIGLGNALVDIMTKIDTDAFLNEQKLPKGSMQLVDQEVSNQVLHAAEKFSREQTSGGSAANTIHGLAKLGIESAFVGVVGDDELGNFFASDLRGNNIYDKLTISKTETGRAVALVSPDSERTFAVYLGAAIEMTPEMITPETFDGYDILHIEGYLVQNHALVEKALATAKGKGLQVSLDLASYNVVDDNRKFLIDIIKKYVDIVFANEEESKSLTGKEPREALYDIAEMCEIAVVKLGKEGSLIRSAEQDYMAGVIDVNPIDTTGAGDLYASGFLYGLIKGYSFEKCAIIGAILSGLVIELIGAKLNEEGWNKALEMIRSAEA